MNESQGTKPTNPIISMVISLIVFGLVALVYFLFLHDDGGLKQSEIYSYNETELSISITSGDSSKEEQLKTLLNGEWNVISYSFDDGTVTEYVNGQPTYFYQYTVNDNLIYVYNATTSTTLLKQFAIGDKKITYSYQYEQVDVIAMVTVTFSR